MLLRTPRPQPGRCVCMREAWSLPSNSPGHCLPLTLPIREHAQASLLTLVLPAPSHDVDLERKGSALFPLVLRARRWAPEPPSSPPQELQGAGGALMSGLQRAPPRARQGCLNQMPSTQVFLVLRSPISHRLRLDCVPGPVSGTASPEPALQELGF